MSEVDALEYIGYLFIAYSTGWLSGWLQKKYIQGMEKV